MAGSNRLEMGSLAKTRKAEPFNFKESGVSRSQSVEQGVFRISVVRFVSVDVECVFKYVDIQKFKY